LAQKYLITGGAGNLACQLTFLLADSAERVVLFDLAERPVAPTAPRCVYIRGDLTAPGDVRRVLDEQQPNTVLHLASLLSGSCEQNRRRGWQVNSDGTFALLEAAVQAGVRQVFFPSSLAAYGGQLPDPLPEDYPQWPTGLYGVTKVACERLGIYYHERHGLDFRCLRLPAVISRFAPPGAASGYSSRAFLEAMQQRRFVFQVRPTTRVSTVYVRDALRGIVGLVQAPSASLTRRVYNIHALAPSAEEIAAAIRVRLPDVDLRFDPDPQLVALIESWPAQIVDHSARRDWGWQPVYDLPQLAQDMLQNLER
jgi:nucleoside-diphosphate-sugar epimerase